MIFDSGLELSTWGRVTHFVSWCWSYRLKDFVSAVNGWVRKSGVDGEDVFLWICFFCNNQYRILQEAANARCGMQKRSNTFESLLWALHIATIDNLWLLTLDRSRIDGELCMFHLVHVWSCMSDFFVPVWRLHKRGLMNWNQSLKHIWWKLDTCWYSWILLSEGLRRLTIQSPEKQIWVRCSFLSTFDCEWTKATSVCQESMVHLRKLRFELSATEPWELSKRAFKTCGQFQMNVQ